MYKLAFKSAKLKGQRWHTHSKVTAFSVETSWANHQTVGKTADQVFYSVLPISTNIGTKYDVHTKSGTSAKTSFGVRAKTKAQNKCKKWEIFLSAMEYRQTGWNISNRKSIEVSPKWKTAGYWRFQFGVIFRGLNMVRTGAGTRFQVLVNPTVRSADWHVCSLVGKNASVKYDIVAHASKCADVSWNTEHFCKKAGTSWKAIGRIVKLSQAKFNTKACVKRSVQAKWNVRVKVYSLKMVRYNVSKPKPKLVIPARSLPKDAYKPFVAMIPNITWNKLSTKQKHQLSK